jgi:hypothetical protein
MSRISPPELRRALNKLGFTLAELAELCRIHPVSARRWGSTGVPDGPAAVLIRLLEAGEVTAKAIRRVNS